MTNGGSGLVLVRADSGPRIGMGHVVRQLALARELAARGAEVVFVTRTVEPRVEAAGFRSLALDLPAPEPSRPWAAADQVADARATIALAGGAVDTVIVDSYGLDRTWESEVRAIAGRIVAVDDLADRTREVDVVVDQNWYGAGSDARYDGVVPDGARRLVGPRHALLHHDYAAARRTSAPRAWPPRRVLVSFGGTDPGGETRAVVDALRASGRDLGLDLEVDVVVGTPAAVSEELRASVAALPGAELRVALPSLVPSLAAADLAFGASGTATWERMCLDVPAVVTTTAPHQSGVTRALAEAGFTTWAGLSGQVGADGYRDLVAALLADGPRLAPPLVDGHGAARVAAEVLPGPGTSTFRAATGRDAPVEVARGDDPGAWVAAAARFADDLADPSLDLLVAEVDGVPVDVVRRLHGASPTGG